MFENRFCNFDTSKRRFQTQFMNTLNCAKIFKKTEFNWEDVIDYENWFEYFLSLLTESGEMFENR